MSSYSLQLNLGSALTPDSVRLAVAGIFCLIAVILIVIALFTKEPFRYERSPMTLGGCAHYQISRSLALALGAALCLLLAFGAATHSNGAASDSSGKKDTNPPASQP